MKTSESREFMDWIGTRLYLAARDGATIELGVLSEVYQRLFGHAPDLDNLQRQYGEHSVPLAPVAPPHCEGRRGEKVVVRRGR